MKKIFWNFMISWFAIMLTVFSFEGFAFAQEESVLDKVVKRGFVRVGVTTTSPPFGFMNEKNQLVGFDIDTAKIIAKGLFDDENKIEFVPLHFSGRWAAVQTGKIDMGIMMSSIYPNRIMKVDFTTPYDYYAMSVVVRKDSGINSFKDLNDPKFTIADLTNPQMTERSKRYYPKTKQLLVETSSQQFLAVSSGRAQALQNNALICAYYAKKNPDLKMLEDTTSDWESHSIFIKKGDFRWWYTLEQMMIEIKSGTLYQDYRAMYKKWFDIEPPPQFWWIEGGYYRPSTH